MQQEGQQGARQARAQMPLPCPAQQGAPWQAAAQPPLPQRPQGAPRQGAAPSPAPWQAAARPALPQRPQGVPRQGVTPAPPTWQASAQMPLPQGAPRQGVTPAPGAAGGAAPSAADGLPLHDYQRFARDWIVEHKKCALFLDCGYGKTLSTLAALMLLNPQCHVLVVAPKNVARSVWSEEIEKWHMPLRHRSLICDEGGKVVSVRETARRVREDVLASEPALWFVNRERVPSVVGALPVMLGKRVWPFPWVVADELQSFKSPTSKRFKALAAMAGATERFIGLTGTPTPKGIEDLWAEMFLIDQGARLGPSMSWYRSAFFDVTYRSHGRPVAWRPKLGAEQEVRRRISDVVVSTRSSAIRLPPLTVTDDRIVLDADEWALYASLVEQVAAEEAEALERDAGEAARASRLRLNNKLRQIASGTLYRESGSDEFDVVHDKKLERLDYIVENTDSPVIVAYDYRASPEVIVPHLRARGVAAELFDGSPDMVRRWNERQIPVMLLQPRSAGTGLNLQAGGSSLVWYTLPWSLDDYIQTNDRIFRQGQRSHVVIHRLICASTIDERVAESLANKDFSQEALMRGITVTIRQARKA